jgi:hypothetical protein
MVHIGRAHGIVAGLDITIVGGQIERRPSAFVGDVGIGAVIQKIGRQLVVLVLGRGEQRGPAVIGDLIDVSPGFEQDPGAIETIFACREDERC